MAPEDVGYPDSVARGEDAHPGKAANDSANARKEWAGPGHAGRADDNKPIGPQSGFAPLGDEEAPHGSGEYTGDESAYRKEFGSKA